MKIKKVSAFIQARLGSTRLPGKILKKIDGTEVIVFMINRLKKCKKIDDIVILIPKNKSDNKLYKFLKKKGYNIFRGSEKNVLKRYYNIAKKNNKKHILRLTSDCPFIDPNTVDSIINVYQKGNYDYVSNEYIDFPDE